MRALFVIDLVCEFALAPVLGCVYRSVGAGNRRVDGFQKSVTFRLWDGDIEHQDEIVRSGHKQARNIAVTAQSPVALGGWRGELPSF